MINHQIIKNISPRASKTILDYADPNSAVDFVTYRQQTGIDRVKPSLITSIDYALKKYNIKSIIEFLSK